MDSAEPQVLQARETVWIRTRRTASVLLFCLMATAGIAAQAGAQDAETDQAPVKTVVPQQVRYAGKLDARSSESVEAVFHIYSAAEGGEPLWTETQQVSVAADGSYSVLLGASTVSGLPQSVFAGGAARWLGVTVERGEEQERVLLSSVPYAMKSADAELLAGHQAGEFATQAQLAEIAKELAVKASPLITPNVTPSGTGTTNDIPIWTSSTALGNSVMSQSGSGIAVGSAASPAGLSVAGNINNFASGTYPSMTSSAYNSTAYEGPRMGFNRYDGTQAAPTVVKSGDTVGWFDFFAYDGSAVQRAGQFSMFVDGTPTAGVVPGRFQFSTANSAGTDVPRLTVFSNDNVVMSTNGGMVGIGTSSPTAKLEVKGTAKFDGNITFASTQTFPITGTGGGTITGITTSSPLTGSGTTGSVALGLNETQLATDITPALESTFNGVYPQLAAANTFNGVQTFQSQATISGSALNGPMLSVSNNGDFSSTAITAVNSGNYSTAISVSAGAGGFGIDAIGVQSAGSAGILGYLNGGSGLSGSYGLLAEDDGLDAGIWGDAPTGETSAVIATADNAYAGVFYNDSNIFPTITALNNASGGSTGLVLPGIATVIRAGGPGGICGINQSGNLSCTGQVKTLMSVEGGARQVETYAVQSAENWVEDYGSGQLSHGGVTIQVEPEFAKTVNTGMEFHVFLTPGADCKGLYVSNKTAASFEVHELAGGTSNVPFDYKIVAKRNGMEHQRLVDVTERMRSERESVKFKPLDRPLPKRPLVRPIQMAHPATQSR